MYKLNQPFTINERMQFIVDYQLGAGLRIEETEDVIYALEDNEILKDGEVIINPEWDKIQLAEAKQEKIALNDELRDKALYGGVEYQGVLFDSDTDQKINLFATVNNMVETNTITWYGMDNKALLCTKDDLVAIGQMITKLHSFCWNNNAYIKEQIESAVTISDLEKVEISYDRTDGKEE